MEVRPKRNKPFVCDQCGEETNTRDNYSKIIFVNFVGNKKFRNKFCSLDCFEKWKLLNKKPTMNQGPLEVEITKLTESEKEDYSEEEEPLDLSNIDDKKEKGSVNYKGEENKKKYNKYETNDSKKTIKIETLNLIRKEGIDIVKYPGKYDRLGSVQKEPKYSPKRTLKKFLDIFNILKTKYKRDEYK